MLPSTSNSPTSSVPGACCGCSRAEQSSAFCSSQQITVQGDGALGVGANIGPQPFPIIEGLGFTLKTLKLIYISYIKMFITAQANHFIITGTHGEGSWLVNISAVLYIHVLISWTLGWQQNCGCWNLANNQFPNKRLQVFSSFLGNMFLIKQLYCPTKLWTFLFCFGHHDILEFINIKVALYPTSMVLSGFQALLGTAISPLDSYELGIFGEATSNQLQYRCLLLYVYSNENNITFYPTLLFLR